MGVYKSLYNLYSNALVRLKEGYAQLRGSEIPSSNSIKLITAMIASIIFNTGVESVALAKNSDYKRQGFVGRINNPYQPEDYISKLADNLSPEGRNILLNGNSPAKQGVKKDETYTPIELTPIVHDYKKAVEDSAKKPEEMSSGSIRRDLIELDKGEYATPEKVWRMGEDLGRYREHAVNEGSRHPRENLEKALRHMGLTIDDLLNFLTIGYHSERAEQFRENDGKPFSYQLKTVGKALKLTTANITDCIYATADLAVFDSLPDIQKPPYFQNHSLVRPFVFGGSAVGSGWKTVESAGNTLTWGYFDNLTGSAGMGIVDLTEILKNLCEAGANLVREPFYIVVGEDLNKPLDWILVVPFEYISNAIEMKGISNMVGYPQAFEEKGVIGSIAEMLGSGYLTVRSGEEIVDEFEHKSSKKRVVAKEEEPSPPPPPYKPKPTIPGEVIIIHKPSDLPPRPYPNPPRN